MASKYLRANVNAKNRLHFYGLFRRVDWRRQDTLGQLFLVSEFSRRLPNPQTLLIVAVDPDEFVRGSELLLPVIAKPSERDPVVLGHVSPHGKFPRHSDGEQIEHHVIVFLSETRLPA